jgi:putative membrane protein
MKTELDRGDPRKDVLDSAAQSPPVPPWPRPTQRYLAILAALLALIFIALGIAPKYRDDWALENVLVIASVAALFYFRHRLPLSNTSYTLIFIFLSLHEIGAHYTYAEVPYEEWFRSLSGRSLNALLGWERNNFDRVIHFSSGLLLALPVRQLTVRLTGETGAWSWVVPLSLLISCSGLYELIEWGAAGVFGKDLGMAYLGTQGDIWDAHKDMALAHLGAVIGLVWVDWSARLRPR